MRKGRRGSLRGGIAPLSVAPDVAPTITGQPSTTTVGQGSPATLAVSATGSAPLSYQWFSGASAGVVTTPIGGATSSSYSAPTSTIGTVFYRVRVTNGTGQVDSGVASVSVSAVAPSISSQPSPVSVAESGAAALAVAATGTPTLSYQWFSGTSAGVVTTLISGATSATYAPPTATVGTIWYRARVTNGAGEVFSSAVSVVVTAITPTITGQPSGTSAAQGGLASLSVTAAGTAPLLYQWFSGSSVDTATTLASGATSATYAPPTATVGTAWYRVRVTNGAGEVFSSAVSVVVTAVAPTISSQPSNTTVAQAASATLTVTASGTTPLSYQWLSGASAGDVTTPIVGATSSSYSAPTSSVGTVYYLVAVTNEAGSVSSSIVNVTVTAVAPTVTNQPGGATAPYNGGATLTVTATGTAPLSYQWYQGTAPSTTSPVGTNSSSFSTPNLTAATAYWVLVTNAAGSAVSATATVNVAPAITTQPQSRTIFTGTSTTLTVVAGGSGPRTFQWYRGTSGDTSNPVTSA